MVDSQIEVAGLKINPITKTQFFELVSLRFKQNQKNFVTTVYSEFLQRALKDVRVMELLNKADFSLVDGVGVLLAKHFLDKPITVRNFNLKILQASVQMFFSLSSILVNPKSLYSTVPEKIVGADLIWDLAEFASKNNYSIYLLGGRGGVAEQTARKLQQRFQNLQVAGFSERDNTDPRIISEIERLKPDMLFVAFNPPTQEQWIANHLPHLPVRLAIGLGGTFDYVAGHRTKPPKFIRKIGLEWLFRLITQPRRFRRIMEGVPGLILSLIRYKVFMSCPSRLNVSIALVNDKQEVLICKKRHSFAVGKLNDNHTDFWHLPQGGVDEGEDLQTAAMRELEEETGITYPEYIATSEWVNEFHWPVALKPLFYGNRKKFKGQTQYTLYFKIGDATGTEVKLRESEIRAVRWVKISELAPAISSYRQEQAFHILEDLEKLGFYHPEKPLD